eukprot:TRINITY_DN6632_c0_g1_i3.p1 TRINITY_DN6632_c0_g1~~TRINITY_DN6632_c0_g1_i3.p1  ORF type:complete len:184 (-),score=29.54 TRINITY_DN6632_c0_g1_i3:79-630(-)
MIAVSQCHQPMPWPQQPIMIAVSQCHDRSQPVSGSQPASVMSQPVSWRSQPVPEQPSKSFLLDSVHFSYGRIVNIASISGKEGNAGMLAYSTSKAAVIGLSKVVGKECAETGVTCNCVAPAVIRTAMVDALPDTQVTYMTDKIPMKRCGTIDEIANLVLFAASRECSFTTGFCFDATGGRATY